MGDTTTPSARAGSAPTHSSHLSAAQRLLFEDVKLPVKHSLGYPGFIPAHDFSTLLFAQGSSAHQCWQRYLLSILHLSPQATAVPEGGAV